MKVEFAAALIRSPRVVFLDEPTIGLDVTMQARMRRFVADYNRRTNATILLTSHYMDDVVALCKRVVVIHHGLLRYDGDLSALVGQMAPYKLIGVTLRDDVRDLPLDRYGEEVARDENRVTLRVARDLAAALRFTFGVFYLVQGTVELVFQPSVTQMMEQVRLGTLDFTLLKPVNSQFLVSVRFLNLVQIAQVALGGAVLGVGLAAMGETFTMPAQAIAGRLDPFGLVATIAAAVVAWWFAGWFWRRGLSNYTGASA